WWVSRRRPSSPTPTTASAVQTLQAAQGCTTTATRQASQSRQLQPCSSPPREDRLQRGQLDGVIVHDLVHPEGGDDLVVTDHGDVEVVRALLSEPCALGPSVGVVAAEEAPLVVVTLLGVAPPVTKHSDVAVAIAVLPCGALRFVSRHHHTTWL